MNDVLQNALIEHYIESKGLITEQDVGVNVFKAWCNRIDTLFDQALVLNRQDWNNPTELKECSRGNAIWETIREIYDEMIGQVNSRFLQRNADLVCLVVAYAIKHRKISDKKLSTKDSFRLKMENFLAREIMAQRRKPVKIIEDELLDRKNMRSLRKKDICSCKFQANDEGNSPKIDFSEITQDGYKKVCMLSRYPTEFRNYIDSNDEQLVDNYILFFFGQIGNDVYASSWARFLIGLGLKPTKSGIAFLARRVDREMQEVMYEHLIKKHATSQIDVIKAIFYKKLHQGIKEILDEEQIYKAAEENEWKQDSILYIYKGKTRCHTRGHQIVSATAVLIGRNDSKIKLNVEYCSECNRFFMGYTVYESYREKYGMLIGKLRMDSASTADYADIILSECSPLKLCGYSVNQQDAYSTQERQYIISKVIELGILQKNEVTRYLEYFINRNGRKGGNEIALSKWKQDLDFTLSYKLSEQREYEIRHIKKY